MRSQDINEYYITGDAHPREKFRKWAQTLENAVANPLYHWSHLELAMYFNVHEVLNEANADRIYDEVNQYLKENHVTTQTLITQSNVQLICTTDNPKDYIAYHDDIKSQTKYNTTILHAYKTYFAFKIGDK